MPSSDANIAAASRRYFNRWAAHYDRSPVQIWFQENHRLIVEALGPAPDACILDLGCGTGQLAARLATWVPDGAVIGMDPAEEMIRVARRRRRKNLHFEVGSSDAIPAGRAVFDAVVSTVSFHHWSRPAASLRDIARVLKPDGRVLILDFCRDGVLMAALDQLQHWLQPSHAGFASARDMRRYLSRAGFRRIQIANPRCVLMLVEGRSPGATGPRPSVWNGNEQFEAEMEK